MDINKKLATLKQKESRQLAALEDTRTEIMFWHDQLAKANTAAQKAR